MATTTKLYSIRCITNLHAGSGDESYGVIDKLVQRDASSGRPCIFSSSLKGSLREYFEVNHWKPTPNGTKVTTHANAKTVFGSSVKEENNKTEQGAYRFLSAQLLSLPVRSNKRPYYAATCSSIVTELLDNIELNGYNLDNKKRALLDKLKKDVSQCFVLDTVSQNEPVFLEDHSALAFADDKFNEEEKKIIVEIFGNPFALIPDKLFGELCENLPVIARNQLENGESKNLWYEEVVPREARFWFVVIEQESSVPDFEKYLLANTIQVGANASIGYGLTRFTKI